MTIFDPFFTTKDVAISQRIVRSHGGRIELGPSEPGRGAEFIVWLALDPAAEPPPPKEPPRDP
jgi:signal transduction histidine kinase